MYSSSVAEQTTHGVALAERAPPGVLPGEPHRRALEHQRAEGERFGERPVDLALLERDRWAWRMRSSFGCTWNLGRPAGEALDDRPRTARSTPVATTGCSRRRDRGARLGRGRRRRSLVGVGRRAAVRLGERGVEVGLEVGGDRVDLLLAEVAPLDELLGVQRARRAVLADELVHARLSERGLVGLVVAVAAVAEQVDDDVLVEGLAERERESHDAHGRLGIVAVHVEDRRLHHLGDVGRVDGRAAGCRARS